MGDDAEEGFRSHGGGCNCSICAGTIAFSPEMRGELTAADLATAPLSSLPQLSSLPGSQFTLFLDFDGGYTTGWESYAVHTPPYDFDNNLNSFSTAELKSIEEIWARVAEDYAPFNINVTTVDPGNLTNGRTAKIAIGGHYSDWFGSAAGGVAYVGGFYNAASNVGFVFSDALANGVARYVAEATSHEAGHLFGLWHQSEYSANGTKTSEYSDGNSQWAPIMGVGYYSAVTTWHYGANNLGANYLQDDMSILSNASNGFGYRADEAGHTANSAATLTVNGSSVSGYGVISQNTDQDWYRFSTSGGSVSLTASVASVGANLDTVLELRRADGSLVGTASPTSSLSATITANLSAGDYFLVVKSAGVYGFVGQYTLSGTVPMSTSNNTGGNTGGNTGSNTGGNTGGGISGDGGSSSGGNSGTGNNNNNPSPTGPEITVLENGTQIMDGGAVSYGTVPKKTTVAKTFTIRNDGDANLVIGKLKNSYLPKGFKLAGKFKGAVIEAGESTTITVYMKSKAGVYGGQIVLSTNDADERAFNFGVSGTVLKTKYAGSEIVSSAAGNFDVASGLELSTSLSGDTTEPFGGRIEAQQSDQFHAAIEQAHAAMARTQEALHTSLHGDSPGSSTSHFESCLEDAFEAVEELLEV